MKGKKLIVSPSKAINKQIRVFAWQRSKSCYGRLLIVSFFMLIPTIISLLIRQFFTDNLGTFAISQLVQFLFSPLTIGVAVYSYETYLNGKVEISEIFRFYQEKKLLATSLLLGLVQSFFIIIVSLPDYITKFLPGDNLQLNSIIRVLSLILMIICLYISLRLYLANYIFGRDTNKNAGLIIKESFTYTKGSVPSIIRFFITAMWQIFLLIIIVLVLLSALTELLFAENNIIMYIFFPVILLFVRPYINIASAAYAHKLIPPGDSVRKRQK